MFNCLNRLWMTPLCTNLTKPLTVSPGQFSRNGITGSEGFNLRKVLGLSCQRLRQTGELTCQELGLSHCGPLKTRLAGRDAAGCASPLFLDGTTVVPSLDLSHKDREHEAASPLGLRLLVPRRTGGWGKSDLHYAMPQPTPARETDPARAWHSAVHIPGARRTLEERAL